jgi:hypothetical protein
MHTKSIGVHQFATQKRQITGVQVIVHQVIWCTSVAHTKNCSSHTSGTPKQKGFWCARESTPSLSFFLMCMEFFFGVKSVQPYFFYSRWKAIIFEEKNTTHQHSDIKKRIKRNITRNHQHSDIKKRIKRNITRKKNKKIKKDKK